MAGTWVAGCVLLGVFASQLLALDRSQPVSSYMRSVFTREDGLPSDIVNVLLQTRAPVCTGCCGPARICGSAETWSRGPRPMAWSAGSRSGTVLRTLLISTATTGSSRISAAEASPI